MAPFDEALDIAIPTGASSIAQGDDAIRQFKRALVERFETIIQDIAVDPWVLKKEAVVASGAIEAPKGAVGLKKIVLIENSFVNIFSTQVTISTGGYVALPSADLLVNPGHINVADGHRVHLLLPFNLPAGATITGARLRGARTQNDCIIDFSVWTVSDGVFTNVGGAVSTGTVKHWIDPGAMAAVVPADGNAGASITAAGSPSTAGLGGNTSLYYVEITYNMPA